MLRNHSINLIVMGCVLWACSSDSNSGTNTEPQNSSAGGNSAVSAGSSGGSSKTASGSDSAGKSAANGGGATGGTTASDKGDDVASQPKFGSFDECVAALKPMCSYDDKDTACSSLMTATIPLSNGMTWGNVEIKGGPYGAFVAFNQGKDFANPINVGESSCDILAAAFGEPASTTADVLDLRGADLSLYTVFRPACMKDGETYPVITWGNGTCGQSGGYASLLATVASHGFVVFAANSRFTDAGNNEMLHALDFAKAENENSNSVLYHHLDLDHVGAAGHSQGSSATAHASSDDRIDSVILFNGGTSAMKPYLAVSGERDITAYTPQSMAMDVGNAAQPGAWLFYHKVLETGGNVTGHLTLMEQPERVTDKMINWFKWQLKGDDDAKKQFVGSDCGLCNMKDEFEYGTNAKLQ